MKTKEGGGLQNDASGLFTRADKQESVLVEKGIVEEANKKTPKKKKKKGKGAQGHDGLSNLFGG